MGITFNTFKFVWIPRVLIIAFIVFFSMFSLDVFTGNAELADMLAGFLIHMLPSFVMILFLVITWKKPVAAGVLFIVLGVVFTFFYNTYKQGTSFFTVSFIPILAGLLFFIPSIIRRKTPAGS
ncbi:MAG: hypothetical protein KBA53_09320 [Thermoclostridium sp.]|nr:hypothetical protein [Thermoclostridium sp.]